MRYFKFTLLNFLAFFLGLSSLLYLNFADAELVVIGNPSIKIKNLNQKELSSIYLSKPVTLSTKENLTPISQPDNSLEYKDFYQSIVGWNLTQANQYWSSKLFSGDAAQPQVANDAQEAIQLVQNTPGAIAYVDSSALNKVGNSVKILYGNYTPPKIIPKRKTIASLYDNPPRRSARISGYHSMYEAPPENNANARPTEDSLSNLQDENAPIMVQAPNTITEPSNDAQLNTNSVVNNTILNELQKLKNTQPNTQNIWDLIADQIHLGPEANSARVKAQLKWFTAHPHMLNNMIHNATPFIYYVYQEIQRRHMPMEFALLPMVESDYYPYAYSNVGAAGIWQMMPATATDYGMTIDWWYDARRDIITSTNGALNFLVRLHAAEKNWDLAAAAYNAGPGAVDAAIKKNIRAGKPTDYWDLPLPRETRDYVPRLLAIAQIIKNPARFGITMPFVPNTPYFVAFTLKSQIDVADAAKLANVPENVIVRLNTGMRRFASSTKGKYTLLIPAMAAQTFQQNLAKLAGKPMTSWEHFKISSGQTLSEIANRFHTTVAILESVNKLKGGLLKGRSGILVPGSMNQYYENAENIIQPSSETATIAQSAEFAPMPKVDTWAVEKITVSDILTGKNIHTIIPPAQATPEKPNEKIVLVQPQALVSANTPNTNSGISEKDDLKTLLDKIYKKS